MTTTTTTTTTTTDTASEGPGSGGEGGEGGEGCSESDESEDMGKPENEEDIINVILKKLDKLPTKTYMDNSLKKLATKEDLKVVQNQTVENKTQIENLKTQCENRDEEIQKLKDAVAQLEKKVENEHKSYAEALKQGTKIEKTEYLSPRRLNLIIDGAKEEKGENLITVVHTIFKDMGASVEKRDINLVMRINVKKQPSDAKGFTRPIRVCMLNAHLRDDILKRKSSLMDKEKYAKTWVSADEDPETRKLRKETRRIAFIARSKGGNVQLKHDGIIIDGHRYWFNQLENIPENYKVSQAQEPEKEEQSRQKTQTGTKEGSDQAQKPKRIVNKKSKRASQDKMDIEEAKNEPEERMRKVRGGLVFSGKTAKFSHFYNAPFIHKGNRFQCVEQGHSYYLALHAKDPVLAKKVMKETEPLVMKQLVAHLEK